ncbi:hypothetical protein QBC33DRAFT_584298 [Phialemonium atrogriseum]|uniref:Tyrosinase copper-binding domain-containing protein n=1 Tax=Phialemonium atrogriseum TaxID=1093897 RepID=A0AAJ0CEK1_9PEZI|nr:uncharacterized protein QBC33DRAFT_584298 [Phialemonium atrogriseum]KAK1772866.1 hypothetical protein QBC33DRAFT_584298 [Phialemonium atrogriseum]
MHFSSVLTSAFLLLFAQIRATSCGCAHPVARREWRTLSAAEKASYISAVKCLQSEPGSLGHLFDGVRSRYDDYFAVHIDLTEQYHFTGPFLPWHRLFIWQYEADLKNICGYTGTQPYWDWTLDSRSEAAFLASPVFNPATGFGGNGPYIDSSGFPTTNVPVKIPHKTGGGCVQDGNFVNMTVNMGPGPSTAHNPRCLARDFSPWLATRTINSTVVSWTLSADSFSLFDRRIQGLGLGVDGMTSHAGGHLSVGGDIGDMGNMYSSPGDPLFYLHHANMDRLWNQWQRGKWGRRKGDITGPDTMFAYPYNFNGDIPYKNITLDTVLNYRELLPTSRPVKIKDVMDTESGRFCYKYT